MGAHTAPPTTRKRRRLLGIPLATWAVIAVLSSAVALAVFFSIRSTAPDNFSVKSVGEVNVGALDGAQLFGDAQFDLGTTLVECVAVEVDSRAPGAGQDPRDASTLKLYGNSYAATSTLASGLAFTVDYGGTSNLTPGKQADCSAFTLDSNLYTGTLDGFGTAFTDFGSGLTVAAHPSNVAQRYMLRFTLELPATATSADGTATLGVTFHSE